MTTPTTPLTIDLGDGVQRRLRYTVAATKRIHEKFGSLQKALELPPYMSVPLILEGIVKDDREGIPTAEWIEENTDFTAIQEMYIVFVAALSNKTVEEVKKAQEAQEKNAQLLQTPTPTIQ